MQAARMRTPRLSMLVVLVDRGSLLVVGVFVIVVMGMAVGQFPVGMFVIMGDHRCRGLAAKTSATLAHVGLLAPEPRRLDDDVMTYRNPFRFNGKGTSPAQVLHKTPNCATSNTISCTNIYSGKHNQLYLLTFIFWHAACFMASECTQLPPQCDRSNNVP
jgi:hypothetical protein